MELKRKNTKWFLPKQLVFPAAGCLVAAAIFLLLALNVSHKLYDQQAAKLWETGEEMPYSQISVFLARDTGLNYNSLMKLRHDIDEKYIEDGISSVSETARLWVDAASAESTATATHGSGTVNVSLTAVTGDYFRFHPLSMMSGQYLNPDEASKDIVLLDWTTAWRLFGGYEIAGMQVEIAGRRCVVGGVFEKDAEDTAENRIIVSYELYELINSLAEFSALEFILPNPVTGYGLETVSELMDVSDENHVIVENGSRFRLASLFKAVTDFGGTIAQSKSIALPYNENRARVAEFNGGVFLLLAAFFAILPAFGVIMALIKIYRRRSAIWSFAKSKLKREKERTIDDLQEINGGVANAGDDADDTRIVRGERD